MKANFRISTHKTPSGVTRYFSHSTAHCSSPIGGKIPLTGSHSVILSPDSVNRVTPPTTTMKNTRPEEMYNHLATAGVVRIGNVSLRVSE